MIKSKRSQKDPLFIPLKSSTGCKRLRCEEHTKFLIHKQSRKVKPRAPYRGKVKWLVKGGKVLCEEALMS